MSEVQHSLSAKDERLAELLDSYLQAVQAGQPPDRQRLLSENPDLADELENCLVSLDFIRGQTTGTVRAGARVPGVRNESTGTTLGDYHIIRETGRGGMGVVYEAEQISLRRRVALKVLPFAAMLDHRQLQRFKNEAAAAAQLHHPNIVPVHALGCERSVHYYAMQFIEGQSLDELLRWLRDHAGMDVYELRSSATAATAEELPLLSGDGFGPRTTPNTEHHADTQGDAHAAISTLRSREGRAYFQEVARLSMQAADALDHAHEMGVVHRDIKPANLLLDHGGKLWVTDFGLARLETDTTLTVSGDLLGTVRYMSPELALAKPIAVDHRTDIYSLGVTMYELLTLRPAFDSKDRAAILHQITFDEPRAPRRLNRSIPRELEIIVLKAMAKNRADRYSTAQQLADDLNRFLEDKPIRAKRPSPTQRIVRWSKRHQGLVVSAIVVLLLAAVGFAVTTLLVLNEQSKTKRALGERSAALTQAEVANETASREAGVARLEAVKAEQNFEKAWSAVDKYFTMISEDLLLNEPGFQLLRRRLLEEAMEYYEEFVARHRTDPTLQNKLAAAYYRVGTIRLELGELDQALAALEKGLTVQQSLAGHNKTPLNLARTHSEIGLVLAKKGRITKALHHYQRSLSVVDSLQSDDSRIAKQRASVLNRIAVLYTEAGDTRNAILYYQDALKIRQSMSATPQNKSAHAGVLHNLAVEFRELGKLDKAMELYGAAIDLNLQASNDRPNITQFRRFLGNHHFNIGKLLWEENGDHQAALDSYEAAITVRQELVARNPDVVDYQVDLASVLLEVGTMYCRLDKIDQGIKMILEAREIVAGERIQQHVEAVSLLGKSFSRSGLVLAEQKRINEAIEDYKKAITHQKRAVGIAPHYAHYREALRAHYRNLTTALRKSDRHKDALQVLNEAGAYFRGFAATHRDYPLVKYDLAQLSRKTAHLHIEANQPNEALDSYLEAFRLLEADQGLPYRRALALLCDDIGLLQYSQDEPEEAIDAYVQACQIYETIIDEGRDRVQDWSLLAKCYDDLAVSLEKLKQVDNAIETYHLAISHQEKALEIQPKQESFRKRLHIHYRNLTMLLGEQMLTARELTTLSSARKSFQRLLDIDPHATDCRKYIANCCGRAGDIHRKAGELESAATAYEDALKHIRVLVRSTNGTDPTDLQLLGATLNDFALVLSRQKKWDEAEESLEEAIEAQLKAFQRLKHNSRSRGYLLSHYLNLAQVLFHLNRPVDSARALIRRRDLWNSNIDHLYESARLLVRLGRGVDSKEQATQIYGLAIESLRQAIETGFDDRERLQNDSNFKVIHQVPAYQQLIKMIEQNTNRDPQRTR